MTELAIIIVSWNVRDLLRRCLLATQASLAGSGIAYEIIVVDNGSSDGSPAMLRAEFQQTCLLEPGRNLGFTGGNNLALRALGFGQPSALCPLPSALCPPALCLLLNPDTEPQGDALPVLVRYLQEQPDVVAVGPQLRYGDGGVQSSRRRFPEPATFFWESTPLERLWPANPWARRYHCRDRPDNLEQRVGWLVGAALLVRGETIARAGLLDEGFFMYSEELEWQFRMQNAKCGMQNSKHSCIAYLPAAVVVHHEGQSSEQALVGRHLHFQRSKLRLAAMLYGPGFALLLRVFLLLCYGWELGAECAKWLLGHRRRLRRERIGVYAAVLRGLIH
jgi:GT2 family glycosyltransferase